MYTRPETNISPENRGPLEKGDSELGNYDFKGLIMLVPGRVNMCICK